MNKAHLIIITKARALKNSLSWRSTMKRLPIIAIALIFWALLYLGAYKGLYYIKAIEILGEALAGRLVSMIFFSLMGFLFLSNLITAISSFYLSRDIGFLRTLPVGVSDILTVKTVETVSNSSWMVMSFIPPVLVAMGTVYGAPASYYIQIFLLFVLFILISSGIGILSAHILTWLFPAKKLRDALLIGLLAMFVVLYFAFQSTMPGEMENPIEIITSFTAFQVDSPFLPCYWITEAAMALLRGNKRDILYPMLLVSNSAFLLLVSHIDGARLFAGNVERIRTGGDEQLRGAENYPGKRCSLLWKDSRLFFRDAGQWSQLLIIIALAFVYIYNFKAVPVFKMAEYVPLIREVIVLLNVLMAGMVLAAVSARFTYSSVSLEGRAFWIVRSSPLSMKRFLINKLLLGILPVSVLTLGIVVLSDLMVGTGMVLTVISSVTVLLLCISVGGLGAGMGAVWPKFKYENIASVSMSLGGMAFMIMAMGVVLTTVGLVALPYYLYLKAGSPNWAATAGCIMLVLVVNMASFYLPLRFGLNNLERDCSYLL